VDGANNPGGRLLNPQVDILWYPVLLAAVLLPTAFFWKGHEPLEALMLGSAAGLTGWAALAFARFAIILPSGPPRATAIIALTIATAVASLLVAWLGRRRMPAAASARTSRRLLLAVAGVALMTLGLEAALPHYGIAMLYWDWWEHYDLANFYRMPSHFFRTYGDGSTVTSRTPLFNLLTSLALSTVGDRFTVAQVLTAALGWLWALPAALLARRLLAERAVNLIAALAFSPMILFCATYSWPKPLALFSALFALERFLRLRQEPKPGAFAIALQFGLACGLTVLAHAGYVGYVLPLGALLLRDAWLRRASWLHALSAAAMALLVVAPWYAWGIAEYGWRAGLFGYPQPASPTVALWLADHLMILGTSLLPASFFVYTGIGLVRDLFIMYLGSSAGLLGLVFLVRSLAGLLSRRRASTQPASPETSVLVSFVVSGVLVATILINGWGNGWAAAQAVFLPALVVLALVLLRRHPLSPVLAATVAAESLAVIGLGLLYMWTAAQSQEPNALLAAALQVHFLGRQTWPLGCALLIAGAAVMARLTLQSSAGGTQPLANAA
jgi:hypothetical protein